MQNYTIINIAQMSFTDAWNFCCKLGLTMTSFESREKLACFSKMADRNICALDHERETFSFNKKKTTVTLVTFGRRERTKGAKTISTGARRGWISDEMATSSGEKVQFLNNALIPLPVLKEIENLYQEDAIRMNTAFENYHQCSRLGG
jgi:hypothetical protein